MTGRPANEPRFNKVTKISAHLLSAPDAGCSRADGVRQDPYFFLHHLAARFFWRTAGHAWSDRRRTARATRPSLRFHPLDAIYADLLDRTGNGKEGDGWFAESPLPPELPVAAGCQIASRLVARKLAS